jgi:hypothetical protein
MLFSWYVVSFDSYNKIYGSLGAGVGFMVWIWLLAVIVLLGAELHAEMERQTAKTARKGCRSRLAPMAPTWRIMLVRRTPDARGNAVARDAVSRRRWRWLSALQQWREQSRRGVTQSLEGWTPPISGSIE